MLLHRGIYSSWVLSSVCKGSAGHPRTLLCFIWHSKALLSVRGNIGYGRVCVCVCMYARARVCVCAGERMGAHDSCHGQPGQSVAETD